MRQYHSRLEFYYAIAIDVSEREELAEGLEKAHGRLSSMPTEVVATFRL